MGGALLEHWMSGGEEFTIVDPMLETAPEGVRLVRDRSEIAEERFDTIIVAIKPQMIDDVLPDYAANLAEGGYVLSIAAGASAARLAKAMDGAPVVRVMPNLPAAVGKGTSGVLAGPDVSDAQADHAMEMMRRTGTAVAVENEDMLDRATAVAGSGPGYVFEIARSYVAAAEKLGFDAYGVSRDMPDPVARAIGQMLDHMHAVDSRLEGMCKALSELGSDYCAKELPALGGEDFDLLKDDETDVAATDATTEKP